MLSKQLIVRRSVPLQNQDGRFAAVDQLSLLRPCLNVSCCSCCAPSGHTTVRKILQGPTRTRRPLHGAECLTSLRAVWPSFLSPTLALSTFSGPVARADSAPATMRQWQYPSTHTAAPWWGNAVRRQRVTGTETDNSDVSVTQTTRNFVTQTTRMSGPLPVGIGRASAETLLVPRVLLPRGPCFSESGRSRAARGPNLWRIKAPAAAEQRAAACADACPGSRRVRHEAASRPPPPGQDHVPVLRPARRGPDGRSRALRPWKSLSPAAPPPPPPPVSRRLPIRWPPSRSPSPSRFRRGRGNSAGPSKRKIWLPNTRSAGGRRRASEARVPTPLHARKARASGGAGAPDRPYARSSPLESLPREPAPARRDSSSLPVNHEGC